MPTYSAWYSTGEYGKLWFEADSLEHAEELAKEVRDGEASIDDLPQVTTKVKGDEWELDGLEEISK